MRSLTEETDLSISRRTILTGAAALMATAVMPAPVVADEYTDTQGVLLRPWRHRKVVESERAVR